jgi:hypothetical protein
MKFEELKNEEVGGVDKTD